MCPNVVIVLIDDIGFGANEAFGGGIEIPTFERLANEGLRFNHFHTTALCSPTRAALLSGRNQHQVNVCSVIGVCLNRPMKNFLLECY
ncbi:MAG: sulfatase-like hydrolase/transferase [Arenicellales bacterium]